MFYNSFRGIAFCARMQCTARKSDYVAVADKYYYFFRGDGNFHNFGGKQQKRFYAQNFVFCTRIWYNFL